MITKSKLNLSKWLSVLPLLAELVGTVVVALKDGRVSSVEATKIGEEFVAIIAAVMD